MNIDEKWAKRKQAEEYRRKRARRAREKRQAADPEFQKGREKRARQEAEKERAWAEKEAEKARSDAMLGMDMLPTYASLKLLEIDPPSKAIVDYAYKVMMQKHHPDKGGTVEMVLRIRAARKRLYVNNDWK